MAFAKANYSSGSGTTWFTLKEDENGDVSHNYYRVLPAYGKYADPTSRDFGKYIEYYAQHFGYKGVNPSGGEPYHRPFGCIHKDDRKSGMVLQECPECINRASHQAQKDNLEGQLKAEGKSEKEIKEDPGMREFAKWFKDHNLDKKYYVAAMNQKGDFGILKLPWEAQDKMKKCIKERLSKDGVDATDCDQGFWLDFKRSGKGFTGTSYEVEGLMDSVKGEGGRTYYQLKMAPLSAEQQAKAEATLPSLADIPRVITEEQIQRLVDGSGDPEEVDAIMGIAQRVDHKSQRSSAAIPEPTPAPKAAAAPTPVPKPTPAAAPKAAAPGTAKGETQEERDYREFQEFKARKAAAAAAAPVQAQAPAASVPTGSTTGDIDTEGDKSFLSNYGFNEGGEAPF